jgi:hypothetical protein
MKDLGITLKTRNVVHGKIRRGIYFGKACYYLDQEVLTPVLLFRMLKINMFTQTIIISFEFYVCVKRSCTFSVQRKVQLSENEGCKKYVHLKGRSEDFRLIIF